MSLEAGNTMFDRCEFGPSFNHLCVHQDNLPVLWSTHVTGFQMLKALGLLKGPTPYSSTSMDFTRNSKAQTPQEEEEVRLKVLLIFSQNPTVFRSVITAAL